MDIQNRFFEVFKKDKSFIKDWLVKWDYQQKRKKRAVKYDEVSNDFYTYNGANDLLKWMNWFSGNYSNYIQGSLLKPLMEASLKKDKEILASLQLNSDFPHLENVALNNAHDFLLPQSYPSPDRYKIKNIIDFGAGYGRQANLWTEKTEDVVYVGIDATPQSYCLQNLYYSSLKAPLFEYIDSPSDYKIDLNKKGIYHIPTWRYDLLPDNSFDLVICVQVLPELNRKLIKTMFRQFQRVLKPGGMLYIRDHGSIWKPTYNLDTDKYLKSEGFVLEFKPHIILDKDLHGMPRMWRKSDPAVIASQTWNMKLRTKQLLEDADAMTGGSLKKIKQKIFNKNTALKNQEVKER